MLKQLFIKTGERLCYGFGFGIGMGLSFKLITVDNTDQSSGVQKYKNR